MNRKQMNNKIKTNKKDDDIIVEDDHSSNSHSTEELSVKKDNSKKINDTKEKKNNNNEEIDNKKIKSTRDSLKKKHKENNKVSNVVKVKNSFDDFFRDPFTSFSPFETIMPFEPFRTFDPFRTFNNFSIAPFVEEKDYDIKEIDNNIDNNKEQLQEYGTVTKKTKCKFKGCNDNNCKNYIKQSKYPGYECKEKYSEHHGKGIYSKSFSKVYYRNRDTL